MIDLKITDVRAHPGDSAFLIDDGKTAILYDTGFAFTGYAVADKIKAALGKRSLDYIFLTHSHYDHALGSVYALKYWPEAKVVAGEYAFKIFAKDSAKQLMRSLDRKFAEKCGVSEYEDLIDDLKADIAVQDGDTIKAGDMTFRAIALPGHTKCSVAFYLIENKLLLSCETLGVYDGKETIFPSYLVGYRMALDSIAKAKALDIENILLPHLGLLSKEQTKFYLDNIESASINYANAVADILRNGGTKADVTEHFRKNFYHEDIKLSYPPDAMELNTGIIAEVIRRELVDIQ
ncbi:MAG: MBL fold metallo-hydrolase [Ruminococcaceae bacterium]|nr:MBL fold metallo-hydrolase [Oscillospiraceae bacterium]